MRSSLKLDSTTKINKQQLKRLKTIATSLYESNDAYDFRQPVDWKGMGLTDYPTLVKYPMDLSTVNQKLKMEKYSCVQEALDDIQLVWDNCKIYNPDKSWIHNISDKMERYFKKMLKNYFSDFNIPIPIKLTDVQKDNRLPSSLFEDENEDVTYHQKLLFCEELSKLSSDKLELLLKQIELNFPEAYRDLGQEKGQILVDNMDVVAFNQINQFLRNLANQEEMIEQEKQKDIQKPRARGRPKNPQKMTNN